MSENTVCARCILDDSIPGVSILENGRCNHCRLHDRLEERYGLGDRNSARFQKLLERIKSLGAGRDYDCIVGLSGGTDSTYCVYMAKKLGLRPLAVHFNNGWVSGPAIENIRKTSEKLGVDVREIIPDWEEMRQYYLAALRSSLPEVCLPCEIGIASSLYRVAAAEKIKYILLGTSYRTEGINPPRWHYMDGAYFEGIVAEYSPQASVPTKLNRTRLPHLLDSMILKGIRTVQLPLYIDYHEMEIRETLRRELGWEYGGRHHFDCVFKPMRSYIVRKKFGIDYGRVTAAALVRSGEITREDALSKVAADAASESSLSDPSTRESVEFCLSKLGMSHQEFEKIMEIPPRDFKDQKSYYSLLSRVRFVIRAASRLRLVPETVYEKLFEIA